MESPEAITDQSLDPDYDIWLERLAAEARLLDNWAEYERWMEKQYAPQEKE